MLASRDYRLCQLAEIVGYVSWLRLWAMSAGRDYRLCQLVEIIGFVS